MDFMYPLGVYLTITQGFHSNHVGHDYGWNGKITGACNQPIIACEDGTVITAIDGYGNTYPNSRIYGNYVIVSHGSGWYTLYGHLLKGLAVSKGQKVSKGQVLGYMGNSGYSMGQHLHFELRKGGNSKSYAVDPLDYLSVQNNIIISDSSKFRDEIKIGTSSDGIGTPVARDATRDQLEVLINDLNARNAPSVNADRLGYVNKGLYNVHAEMKVGDFLFYEIEPDVWCASSEGWTVFHEKQNGFVYIKIGPMSSGDYQTIKSKATSLSVNMIDNGDGALTVGPMSAGDRVAMEQLATALGLPVEVVDEQKPEPTPSDEDEAEKIAAENEEMKKTLKEIADITAQA